MDINAKKVEKRNMRQIKKAEEANTELLAIEQSADISIFNTDNPRSVYNLLPSGIQERVMRAYKASPHLFEMDESDLYKYLRKNGLGVNPSDNRLRLRFWSAYEECQMEQKKKMDIGKVTYGVCSAEFFYNKYLLIDSRVAWLLIPPTSYSIKAEEALAYGMEQLRELLEVNHYKDDGKIDPAIARMKLDIVKMLDVRVQGAVVQKTMNLQLNADKETTKQIATSMAGNRMQNLNQRLVELRSAQRKLLNGGVNAKEDIIIGESKPTKEEE